MDAVYIINIVSNIEIFTAEEQAKLINFLEHDELKAERIIFLFEKHKVDLGISLLKQYLKKSEPKDLSMLYKFYQKAVDIGRKKSGDQKNFAQELSKINMFKLSKEIDLDTLEEMKQIPFDDEELVSNYFSQLVLNYDCYM